MRQVLVGTGGWAHDDWAGPFYPENLERGAWLHHYAEHFPAVEVTFTEHHLPSADDVAAITDRMRATHLTHAVFRAPAALTHAAIPSADADQLLETATEFLEVLDPAAEAGLLAGILLQFDHRTGPAAVLPGLEDVRALSPRAPLFVEVRHAAFNEDQHYRALRRRVEPTGGAVVATDDPSATITQAPPAATAYFRFHGRNRVQWFEDAPPALHQVDRYDHLYTAAELDELAQRVRSADASRIIVMFNNIPRGQAALNAMAFMRALSVMPPGRVRTLEDFA